MHLTGLWRNADFMKLWSAQTISAFGSIVTGTALPLVAILTLDAAPAEVGLLAAMGMFPSLLLGLPAGVWVDRLRRRPLLITADLGRALVLLWVPVAAWMGILDMFQLYAVAALAGALTLFFRVADNTYLPTLVGRHELVEANSKLGISDSVSEIAAPTLAGFLVQTVSAPLTLLIDALTYLASALLITLIRTPETPVAATEPAPSLRAGLVTGLRLVHENPLLRALAASNVAFALFGGFIGALYSLYVIRTLAFSPTILGILISAGGAGALAGAFLTGPLTRRLGLGPVLSHAFLALSILAFTLPLAAWLPATAALVVLFLGQLLGDLALAIYFIAGVSLRQTITPNALLGRMNASFEFLVTGIAPLGFLLGGLLGDALGIQLTLLIAVCGRALGWLVLQASPIRHFQIPGAPHPEAGP